MKTTGRIFIAAVLSTFIVTLAVESEARRGNYRGRGHLSRPGHFKSGHKRSFPHGHYKRSSKHRYRYGYSGHGVKHRYGYKRSFYRQKHYRPRLFFGHRHKHGFSLKLGHGLYGHYGYYGYHPFRYPYGKNYYFKRYKTRRYYNGYFDDYPGSWYEGYSSVQNLKRLIEEESQTP